MKEEDLIASLTRQVKEEVLENYITERNLVGLQIEDLQRRAQTLRFLATKTGRRLSRLAYLLIHPEMVDQLSALLRIPQESFWGACLRTEFKRGVRFIRVRALTDRAKFRKLVLEAYKRLFDRMDAYRRGYEDLQAECRAVNSNILQFQRNFDLLGILSFLKSLDAQALEHKRILGQNFTPEELSSIDRKLHIGTIAFEKLEAPEPLPLPTLELVDEPLSEIAQSTFRKYTDDVKRVMQ